jgi:hypothetical protein
MYTSLVMDGDELQSYMLVTQCENQSRKAVSMRVDSEFHHVEKKTVQGLTGREEG